MSTLYIYNPTCDMAVENGTNSYMPPKTLSVFENEISPLMAFLGNEDDYVLYNAAKPQHYIDFWSKLDVKLPQFIRGNQVSSLQISKLVPWGWSQLIERKIQDSSVKRNNIPVFESQDAYQLFFSRLTSVKLIGTLSQTDLPDMAVIPSLPQIVNSSEEILQCLKKHRAGIVIKNLWSSSGRGLLFIRDEKTYLQNLNRITAQLKKQKQLIVEPIYNKLQDASMQFMIDDNGNYSFLGLNYFDSDEEGRFQREYFHLPDKMRDLLPKDKHWLRQLTEQLILTMQKHGIHRQYTGAIGIDVMFIADVDKQTKLYPLVEANLRCNMGSVNLSLKKLFADNTRGFWQISTFKNDEAALFYKQQIQKHPIRLMNNKITEGFIPLTPFNSDTRFAAWGVVETES